MGGLKPCRYLEENTCIYYDEALRDVETIRCYPGGWSCYEQDASGCIYEDERWMDVPTYLGWVEKEQKVRLPETLEVPNTSSVRGCPQCGYPLLYAEGQPLITCPKCKAQYEREEK